MLRHVSQHDLPLSVQESQRLNNRRMTFHSPGHRRSRELRVTVFPKRKPPDLKEPSNYYVMPDQTSNCAFVREIRREATDANADLEDTENNDNEDELNNNMNKQLQCNFPVPATIDSEDKSTQTNIVINANSTVVAFNHVINGNLLTKPYKIKVRKPRLKDKLRSSSKLNITRSTSKTSRVSKKSNVSRTSSVSEVTSITKFKNTDKSTEYEHASNPSKEKKVTDSCFKLFLKEEFLKFVSFMPLYFVSILTILCTITFVFKLFIEPNVSFIYEKITNSISAKQHESIIDKIISSLFTKPFAFIYKNTFGIGKLN